MPVTVRLPGALRDAAGGETKLIASGGTLREVIADIDRRHPGFASRVLDEAGDLRSYVNVYIGDEDARGRGGDCTAWNALSRKATATPCTGRGRFSA